MKSMNKVVPLEIFYIYFSPYTSHAIEVDGIKYPTLEHAYQCARYTDQNIVNEIKNASSPVKAWEISAKHKHLQIPEFKRDEHKLKVMKKFIKIKATQHDDVYKALKSTGKSKIIKHIVTYPPGDGFWDDGLDGKGLNHTGKIWMEVRKELFFK